MRILGGFLERRVILRPQPQGALPPPSGRVCYNHDYRLWPTLIADNHHLLVPHSLQAFRLSSHRLNNPNNSSSKQDTDNDPIYQGTTIISLSVNRLRDMVVRVSMVIQKQDSIHRRRRSRVRIMSSHRLNNPNNSSSKQDTNDDLKYQETGSIISRGVISSSLDGYGVWCWSESVW